MNWINIKYFSVEIIDLGDDQILMIPLNFFQLFPVLGLTSHSLLVYKFYPLYRVLFVGKNVLYLSVIIWTKGL